MNLRGLGRWATTLVTAAAAIFAIVVFVKDPSALVLLLPIILFDVAFGGTGLLLKRLGNTTNDAASRKTRYLALIKGRPPYVGFRWLPMRILAIAPLALVMAGLGVGVMAIAAWVVVHLKAL